jgi:zinc protease
MPTIGKPVLPIQKWRTKNNVPVYFIRTTTLPILDICLTFAAGSAYDKQLYGIAALTNSMLDEGAGKLNADQIAAGFDNVGAQFATSATRDMGIVSLRSLTKPAALTPATTLLTQIITQPTFPNQELQRLKHQTITDINAQQQLPAVIASKAFYQNLYGNHPYAHPVIGTRQTVNKVNRQHIIQFYREHYTAANAVLTLVGDITQKQAKQLSNMITAKLPQGKPATPLTDAQPITSTITKFIKFPGTQAYIRLGYLGINYHDPNYFPLFVGNYILGGGVLVSRLFNTVRQKHGLSYSIKSNFILLKNRGAMMISLQTKNKSHDQAIAITNKVLQQFIAQGPSKQELQAAQKHLVGSFALKLDSNAKIMDALTTLAFYHLPLNYFDTYKQKIMRVTTPQIKAAFQKLITPQKITTIVLGNS